MASTPPLAAEPAARTRANATGTASEPAGERPVPPTSPALPTAQRDAPSPSTQAPLSARRAVRDYDGRPQPTEWGQVLLWVPRVLLFPAYLVSEYLLRQPFGWLATTAEKNHWPALLVDFFAFGPDHQAGLVPTALLDFGLRPSVGVYGFANDLLADHHQLRLRAAWGGEGWWLFNAVSRYELTRDQDVGVHGAYSARPDNPYYGLGPLSSSDRFRYHQTRWEAAITYRLRLPRTSSLHSSVGVRQVQLDGTRGCCDEPRLQPAVDQGRLPAPNGLGGSYAVAFQQLELALDSRKRRAPRDPEPGSDFVPPPGTGVRLAMRGEHAARLDTEPSPSPSTAKHQSWVTYGATLGGFVDVSRQQRVLGLSVIADFVDPLSQDTAIPFTELISLGGFRPLPGFLQRRLIDRSSIVGQFEYQWPVWVWLDAVAHYAVGNVFGEHLQGFEWGTLRSSFGLGLRTIGARDHTFQLLVAFGTQTFDQRAEIESVRLLIGTTAGF